MKGMVLATGLLVGSTVLGHGGGLNAQGCHTNHKTGDYHCHHSAQSSTTQPRASDANVVTTPAETDVSSS